MNKIYVVAGAVLLVVFILSAMFFLGKLGNLAHFLGEETTKLVDDDTSSFIGTWEEEHFNHDTGTFTFFSDGTCVVDGVEGSWEITGHNLTIVPDRDNQDKTSYHFEFSADETILTLYDNENEITRVLTRV